MNSDKQLQPSTGSSFPALSDLPNLMRSVNVASFQDAIQHNTPTIGRISREYGKDEASGIVAICLIELCSLLSFDFKPEMIKAAADLIAERWFDVKLADLKLFKSKILSGEIGGKLYRIDARVICELFDEYYQERHNVLDGVLERKNTAPLRTDDEGVLTKEQTHKAYQKLMAMAEEKRIEAIYRKRMKDMNLEQICVESGHDYPSTIHNITEQAKTDWTESRMDLPFEIYLDVVKSRITVEARKDINVLKLYY